ncbi:MULTISPECIES: DUF4129 domain-containing protein [unclassified Streptomyces]|uniref:DUF4129 domain-containing protein n=1 Tax=unclassified Streptomyces TaxID=2593676 RepID=UPI000DBA1ECA|nr:DUF4129 domain-containing protein [Streptomyces sp. PsTaAH-137]MYT74497.1 DUF4129 domain-containing protein [Streptomyces sp. SID8367]RAJ91476.1 uncharacterized protein DUF4129 [Streptomyces sp. PsTaAH-137]
MRVRRDVHRAGTGPAVAVGAAGVLALTAAALLLRPAAPLLSKGAGPLGGSSFLVVVLALAWAAGWLVVVRRLRPRIRGDRGTLSPREDRLRQIAVPLLLVGPVALAVLALVLHRFPAGTKHAPATGPTGLPVPSFPTPTPSAEGSDDGSGVPLSVVAAGLAVTLLVLVVVLLAIRLRRYGLSLPGPPARPVAEADTERELLLSVVGEGRRALADGTDARAAVIACYAAMEDALAASGVPRHVADSPADLLTRAARAGLAAGPAAPRLTALFREARYSSHPMDDSRRVAAAEALEEIAALLRERSAQGDSR